MNLWSVTALGIGSMVGAGIFALLGQAALAAGSETYIAFILGGIIAVLSGYSYAKLAARYPDAGGLATYFDHAFGTGRVSGTLSLIYLVTIASACALLAKAFGAYATALVGGGTNQIWIDVFASGVFILLIVLNFAGSGLVGRAEIVLVGIKLIILAVLMIAGAIGLIGKPPIVHVHPHLTAVISSVGLTFLAYSGYGIMANAWHWSSWPVCRPPNSLNTQTRRSRRPRGRCSAPPGTLPFPWARSWRPHQELMLSFLVRRKSRFPWRQRGSCRQFLAVGFGAMELAVFYGAQPESCS
jgi:hypothetical protein